MEFRVLGHLEIRSGGEVLPLGSSKLRSLLALLLLNANHVVSTDRIIDELWGDDVGRNRQNALWVHVSNLRSLLEPDRAKRSEGGVLLTRSPGYVLHVAADDLDAWRFESLLREARSLLEADPAAAALVASEGLALWRGRPYEDLTYESFTQTEIARLEELRLEAVELRIDADLRRGLAPTLVGELESLVRQHPLREAFTADLMVALHRSGRHAEALRAYQRLRAHLSDEIGVEPSASLRALEHKLVVGDPSLDHPGSATGSQTPLAVRGYELREPLGERPFGRVYRAYQPAVGREVTVVVSRPERADDPAFIRRFEADAELVARLEHPHLVPVYDYWREPGAAYMVTPVFRRGNLADLEAAGPLDAQTVARIAADIGSALAFAHQRGVVHRALTPASVQIDDEHHAFVGDFDVASRGERDVAPGDGHDLADQRELADLGVNARRYASPEQLAGGSATPRSDIYALAVLLAEAVAGFHDDVASLLLALPEPLRLVVARATSHDPTLRYPDADAFTAAFLDALGRPLSTSPALVENPYKGLRSFDEPDAADFFGRDSVVERLLTRLGDAGSRSRFVVVVGPSGSGKSSVVKAGLLPALRRGALPGSAEWYAVTVTPGAHPYEELEAALLRVAVNPPVSLLDELTTGSEGIRHAVRHVLPDERSWLLVVLDQFEELFTQTPEPVAHRFLNALAAAVEDPQGRLRVVATLRADCYDRPLQHFAISDLVRQGTEVLTPMTPNELERAIDGPAERVGVRFEPGLVAEMVTEIAARPGALPLLQYSLTELFDHREGAVISASAYHETGGVSGALARRAEALFDELLAPAQETTRQVMLRLVTFGESGQSLRRRVQRAELTTLGDRSVDAVLDSFGDHRLLSFDRDAVSREPTVEIAHEALLTEWWRLKRWIDDARDHVLHQRRLAAAATEWAIAGRDPGYLLTGPALDQMTSWATTTDLQLHPTERAFLDASSDRHDRERLQETERRRREERLRKGTRQRTRLLLVASVVLALLGALTAIAILQRNHAADLAGQLAGTEEARRRAAAASNLAREDPQLALLLGLAAIDSSAASGVPALPEAIDALHWAIQSIRVPYPLSDGTPEVRGGPTGRTGVYRLPLTQLVGLARGIVDRHLTADECRRYDLVPCPGAGSLASPGSPDEAVTLPREATITPIPVDVTEQPLAGTTVTIMGTIAPGGGLAAELARFEERTGIHVTYRVPADFERELDQAKTSGSPPDIAWLSQPTLMIDEAREGNLIDLSIYIDPEEARRRVGDHLVDSASLTVGFYAVPITLDVKGLVWYPAPEFEQAGYTVPTTWSELIALSERIVADGRTPWCMGWENGATSGSPGTDWIEGLLLRAAGVGVYDRWASHEIPFNDPTVAAAASLLDEVAFGNGFVVGGAGSIATTALATAADPMFASPPRCWLHYEGSEVQGHLPPGVRLGVDTSFFPLPPLQPGSAAPLFGGATFAVAYTDRPEVRELMRWFQEPAWGETWAANRVSEFLPANLGFDTARCGAGTNVDGRTRRLRAQLCTELQGAIAANRWRFDASDLMPPEIGGVTFSLITLTEVPGGFNQGMLDYTTLGPGGLERILDRLKSVWPTHLR